MNRKSLVKLFEEELLFSSETAKYLGISRQRLSKLVSDGSLVPIKRSGATSVFWKKELDERKLYVKQNSYDLKNSLISKQELNNVKNSVFAINYFTVLDTLDYSRSKLKKIYSKIIEQIDLKLDFSEIIKPLSKILNITEMSLNKSYITVAESFLKLNSSDKIIHKGDIDYPERLRVIDNAPEFIFARGNIKLLDERIVCVVGSRKASDDGRFKAAKLASYLTRNGIVVASGLARGIDTSAHTGVIQANGKTIAVVGTPLNRIYPKENVNLQNKISKEHLLISQFAPSENVNRWHFPMRNAVMSGLSLATIIVEAGETSGALKQADYAIKQGRFVFIPQSAIDNDDINWPKIYIKKDRVYKFNRLSDLFDKLSTLEIADIELDTYEQLSLLEMK